MSDLLFLKEHPEIAKNVRIEMSASELLTFVDSIKPKPEEVFLTPEQLSEKLDCSVQSLINWDEAKILKPVWFGRLKRYRLSDIEKIGK